MGRGRVVECGVHVRPTFALVARDKGIPMRLIEPLQTLSCSPDYDTICVHLLTIISPH